MVLVAVVVFLLDTYTQPSKRRLRRTGDSNPGLALWQQPWRRRWRRRRQLRQRPRLLHPTAGRPPGSVRAQHLLQAQRPARARFVAVVVVVAGGGTAPRRVFGAGLAAAGRAGRVRRHAGRPADQRRRRRWRRRLRQRPGGRGGELAPFRAEQPGDRVGDHHRGELPPRFGEVDIVRLLQRALREAFSANPNHRLVSAAAHSGTHTQQRTVRRKPPSHQLTRSRWLNVQVLRGWLEPHDSGRQARSSRMMQADRRRAHRSPMTTSGFGPSVLLAMALYCRTQLFSIW